MPFLTAVQFFALFLLALTWSLTSAFLQINPINIRWQTLETSSANVFFSTVEDEEKKTMTGQGSGNENKSVWKITWQREVADKIRGQLKLHQDRTKNDPVKKPLMVSVVGIPGSGKSVGCTILNELLEDVGCMVMPFDGYHYPLDHLKSLPNSDDYIYRRGAPDTFDALALKRDLERIRIGSEDIVKIPGFDHARGDPEHDAHAFCRENTNIVLVEGLYLLHDKDGFDTLWEIFDLSIFVSADIDDCVGRLKVRNKCIPGYSPEEIEIRCEKVDRVNAMIVEASKPRADIIVNSVPFCQLA